MAEKACARDAPPIARRPSFRKTLREAEGTLPAEYLEALEQKRKQLDESIHKYIASKEREYKQYEKDVKQQAKSNGAASASAAAASQAQANGHGDGNGSSNASKRRTSSESTQDKPVDSPFLPSRQTSAVDALLAFGTRREPSGQVAHEEAAGKRQSEKNGPKDKRDNEQREKEFIGVFTPPYLPAIDDKQAHGGLERTESTESAPAAIETQSNDSAEAAEALPRADSDMSVQAKAKRPVHLQLAQRTSSSGSSADGKPASAMKSPNNSAQRPKRKRVSLAVGDSIVAPSDNVPSALSRSSTPSHSRTLSPESEREHILPTVPSGPTATLDFAKQPEPVANPAERVNEIMTGSTANTIASGKTSPHPERAAAAPAAPTSAPPTPKPASNIDPDGDLFDLEEEGDDPARPDSDDIEIAIDSDEDAVPGIAGRIEHGTDASERSEAPMSVPGLGPDEKYEYDPESGLVPEPANASDTQPVWDETEQKAEHLEFGPGSAGFSSSSSQQPTNPGFRRPSVSADPRFRGPDYTTAETKAATEEVYGSSYSRPTSKGSFTAGSLGESFMVKHAEEMMKLRMAKREQEVR